MRQAIGIGGCVLGLGLLASGTVGADLVCTVADPTRSPLNVRAVPNGDILSTLGNGRSVRAIEERLVGKKRWMRIVADGKEKGWVFGAYLDCTPDASKSAPMRPQTPPG